MAAMKFRRGNVRLWETDPDGYRVEFSSPTDAPEESELEE